MDNLDRRETAAVPGSASDPIAERPARPCPRSGPDGCAGCRALAAAKALETTLAKGGPAT